MIALAALIALCIHLGLGWWTLAVVLAYSPVLYSGVKP